MRKNLRLVAALAVLAALLAFAVHEVRKDRAEGKRAEHDIVFPFGARQVAEVTVAVADRKATFRHLPGKWELVSGPQDADPELVTDFIGAWSRVRMLEVVDDAPRAEDLGRFGLTSPMVVVSAVLRPEAAAESRVPRPSLEVGSDAPLQPALYARLDGFPRVVLVSPEALDLAVGVGRKVVGLPAEALTAPAKGGAGKAPHQEPAR